MHLELVGKQDDCNCLSTFLLVRPIRPSRSLVFCIPFVEFECGTVRFGAISPSIRDVANRPFNLPTKGTSQVYWKTFYYSNGRLAVRSLFNGLLLIQLT